MAELIMTGRVLDVQETKKGWLRAIVQGRGRFNEVVLLTPEQGMAAGVQVGAVVSLSVGPSVERDAEGHQTIGIVYFGRDADGAAPAAAAVEKGPKAAA